MAGFSQTRALQALPSDEIALFRDVGGARVAGFRQRTGFESPLKNFRAHVQPTTPRELQFLPGGEEVSEAITLYTKQVLRVSDDQRGREADRVVYRDRRYKVIASLDWIGQGFNTYIAGSVSA